MAEMILNVMRQAALLTVLGVLMLDSAIADIVRHGYLPKPYWGRWVQAGKQKTNDSVVILSVKSYVSHEANCSVDWVSQTASPRGSIYSAHLQCTYHAARAGSKATANLVIWPKSIDEIEVGANFMSLELYRRCSAACAPVRDDHASDGVGGFDEFRGNPAAK
jgi:hypothetical protein